MDIQTAYANAVVAMRDLGTSLSAAVAVRHEPAPGGAATIQGEQARQDVFDPTVDIVLDPRNAEINRAIYAARLDLAGFQHRLAVHVDSLDRAVAAWEGRPTTPSNEK